MDPTNRPRGKSGRTLPEGEEWGLRKQPNLSALGLLKNQEKRATHHTVLAVVEERNHAVGVHGLAWEGKASELSCEAPMREDDCNTPV